MAKDYKRKAISSALLLSILLTGCGEKSECNIPTQHVHRYVKEITDDIDIERYIESEYLNMSGYNRCDDYIEITKTDEDFYNLLERNSLFTGEDNWDYLYYKMSHLHDYLKFYYEYDTIETRTTTDSEGNVKTETYTVHHDGWTENPNNPDNTGRTRLFHHKYFGYRIVRKNGRFTLEKSPLVDDIREIIDEYPYIGESCATEVYEEFRFSRWELDELRPEDFDTFDQPNLESHELLPGENKVYKKEY